MLTVEEVAPQLVDRIPLALVLFSSCVQSDFSRSLQSMVVMQSESFACSHCRCLSTYNRTSFDIPLFTSPKKFLVSVQRTWDQKLSSGLLLTFFTTYLFQFHSADAKYYRQPSWLFTLTFLMFDNKHIPLAPNCRVLKNPVWCGFTFIPSPLSSGLMLVTFVTTHLFQTALFHWLVVGAVLHCGRLMARESLAGSLQSRSLTVWKNMFVLRYSKDAHHVAGSWQG